MWNPGEDVLLTVGGVAPWTDWPRARIRRCDLRDRDLAAGIPAPDLDVALPGATWDLLFSSSWITTSPDGRWPVFPLRERGQYRIFVLDQESGEVTSTGGHGPVGVTPRLEADRQLRPRGLRRRRPQPDRAPHHRPGGAVRARCPHRGEPAQLRGQPRAERRAGHAGGRCRRADPA
jgi:hypothetical protein